MVGIVGVVNILNSWMYLHKWRTERKQRNLIYGQTLKKTFHYVTEWKNVFWFTMEMQLKDSLSLYCFSFFFSFTYLQHFFLLSFCSFSLHEYIKRTNKYYSIMITFLLSSRFYFISFSVIKAVSGEGIKIEGKLKIITSETFVLAGLRNTKRY